MGVGNDMMLYDLTLVGRIFHEWASGRFSFLNLVNIEQYESRKLAATWQKVLVTPEYTAHNIANIFENLDQ